MGKKICICIYTAQNAALMIYVYHFQIQEKKNQIISIEKK